MQHNYIYLHVFFIDFTNVPFYNKCKDKVWTFVFPNLSDDSANHADKEKARFYYCYERKIINKICRTFR